MSGITITGVTKDGEEEEEEVEGGISGMIEEVTVAVELGRLSETSKVVNSSSSRMVLARVLIRRRSHLLCHLVVRRSRAGGRATPTIGKVGEVVGSSRQNRGAQVSLMAPVELFRIGRIRPESRPIMT